MADLPLRLGGELDERLARSLDVEGKIPRALEVLGPIGGRDVLLLDDPALGGRDGLRARQLRDLGGRVTVAPEPGGATPGATIGFDAPDASADVVVGFWTSFRGAAPAELAEANRVGRPGGRLLVVHDYGRDDVSRLRGNLPEYGAWGRRGGPFLANGFRVRVIHCFWMFDSIDDGADFLGAAFGDVGREVAATMKRPRLSYNVAVYHRDLGMPG